MEMLSGIGEPAHWAAEDISRGLEQGQSRPGLIGAADIVPLVSDRDLWDMWQLQREDGATAVLDGRSYWFFLAAPRYPDPNQRHDVARIRLLSHGDEGWRDHGDALPDAFTPGSREWSGSATLASDDETVTLYFTASGRREGGPRFEQRLFATEGRLRRATGFVKIEEWTTPNELFAADGTVYAAAREDQPTNGMILGFRDPGYFRDPADGCEYILFSGSAAWTTDIYDGVIGIAQRQGDRWMLLPPLVEAIGVSKELERAHMIARNGLYYLFWSTSAARFAPGIRGQTGLYGMVADRIAGPWTPLNDTSLVAANPPEEPAQAYCWWVTAELDVISFVDQWGMQGRNLSEHPHLLRKQFGGTVAPIFRLHLAGSRATIVPEASMSA